MSARTFKQWMSLRGWEEEQTAVDDYRWVKYDDDGSDIPDLDGTIWDEDYYWVMLQMYGPEVVG